MQLAAPQVAYLSKASWLPSALRQTVVAGAGAAGGLMTIEAATADRLESALTERLGQVGFDARYEVTDEGAFLEDLIDAFSAA
ncbi:hypothetical protein [uncultured Arthrobacter sp.]|uniref:hypothetical protein n=1 Tax=uncultured Arthrobacter sp. TaxID=114050 RepID=UPI003217B02C